MPGFIDCYKLADWWRETFSDEERRFIASLHAPRGETLALTDDDLDFAAGWDTPAADGAPTLTTGEVAYSELSSIAFLRDLALLLDKAKRSDLSTRVRAKADGLERERENAA